MVPAKKCEVGVDVPPLLLTASPQVGAKARPYHFRAVPGSGQANRWPIPRKICSFHHIHSSDLLAAFGAASDGGVEQRRWADDNYSHPLCTLHISHKTTFLRYSLCVRASWLEIKMMTVE